jgi:hypothetical protein
MKHRMSAVLPILYPIRATKNETSFMPRTLALLESSSVVRTMRMTQPGRMMHEQLTGVRDAPFSVQIKQHCNLVTTHIPRRLTVPVQPYMARLKIFIGSRSGACSKARQLILQLPTNLLEALV